MNFKSSRLLGGCAKDLGLDIDTVYRIAHTAPLRYKEFSIPKRTGGLRRVAQPAREVKEVQRYLIKVLKDLLPLHDAAFAYRTGLSIRENALQHAKSRYLLKMDFSQFFPSIVEEDLDAHLGRHIPDYDSEDRSFICHATLWAPNRMPPRRLCIGAPSSPLLSNSMMFEFDRLVSAAAAELGVIYSRYADDLTFSSHRKNMLKEVEGLVYSAARSGAISNLTVNEKKTLFLSRASKRMVTGITLTPEGKLSVGRERKRLLRSMCHRHSLGLLDKGQIDEFFGLLSFAEFIEPGYKRRLLSSLHRSS